MKFKESFFEDNYIGVYERLSNLLEDYIAGVWVPGPKTIWVPFRVIRIENNEYKQLLLRVESYRMNSMNSVHLPVLKIKEYYATRVVLDGRTRGIKLMEEPKGYRRTKCMNIKEMDSDIRIRFIGAVAKEMKIREDLVKTAEAYESL